MISIIFNCILLFTEMLGGAIYALCIFYAKHHRYEEEKSNIKLLLIITFFIMFFFASIVVSIINIVFRAEMPFIYFGAKILINILLIFFGCMLILVIFIINDETINEDN